MKHNLRELVDVILERIQDSPEPEPTENGLRKWLSKKGYAKREIDAALNLVRPRFESEAAPLELGPGVVRQLSAYEAFKLSREAKDALSRLELYALLDPLEIEVVLDRLDHFEGTLGTSELEFLVSWVTAATHDAVSQRILSDVIEGKQDRVQ